MVDFLIQLKSLLNGCDTLRKLETWYKRKFISFLKMEIEI